MSDPYGKDFDHSNFPPHDDPSNEETGTAELYPESLQDQVNEEAYTHNKVLPRVEGKDYVTDDGAYDSGDKPEDTSTFPAKE